VAKEESKQIINADSSANSATPNPTGFKRD